MLQDLERLWNSGDGNNSLLAPYLRKKSPLKGVWKPFLLPLDADLRWGCARFCSSAPMSLAKSAMPAARANIRNNRGLCFPGFRSMPPLRQGKGFWEPPPEPFHFRCSPWNSTKGAFFEGKAAWHPDFCKEKKGTGCWFTPYFIEIFRDKIYFISEHY
jgi:hypothetical protein